tara:strand:- start:1730 stop:5224 length:3495 start_codon:yes stop_codon:yes gene_type:complete
MSAPTTKSYYIDINRFSAQDSESKQTNIWDYSLNDTIVAPSGSEISVHQAFINQKGITGQSIEFEEDITETINYYGYISEQEQIVPILQDPVETKRGEKHQMNDQLWGYMNLLNNAASGATSGRGKGRYGLWNILNTITEGTYQHLDATKFGGSGTPLILSDPPAPDQTTEFPVNVCISPPNALVGTLTLTPASGLNTFIATRNSVADVVLLSGNLRGITTNRVHFGESLPTATNFTKVYGVDAHLEIATLDMDLNSATFGHGTFSQGWTADASNPIREYTVPVYNAWGDGSGEPIFGVQPNNGKGTASEIGNVFQKGRVDTQQPGYKLINDFSTRAPKVGDRVYDKVGNTIIPMGCKIASLKGDGTGFFVSNEAGTLIDFAAVSPVATVDTRIKTNVEIFVNDDENYYCSPRALSAQITVPKGIYGIQQLVSLINGQLNGLGNPNSKVPQRPYDSGLESLEYDGMINQGTQGFTTKIKPIKYRDAPDSVHLSEINPKENAIFGNLIPDHTLIPAYEYAETYQARKAINMKNRTNFSSKIAGTGYIGYMMNNDITGVDRDGLTLKTIPKAYGIQGWAAPDLTTALQAANSAGTDDPSTSMKAKADYRIAQTTSITVGAPEANIQYDTDTSAFSLNNLHASWRIPSTDIIGNDIVNKGEVGVGLKRCATICDAQPYMSHQSIWGDSTRTILTDDNSATQLRAQIDPGTNVLKNIRFLDGNGNVGSASFMTVGAKLEPVTAAPHSQSDQKLPNQDNGQYCEIIEIVPAATKDSESAGSKGYPDPDDPIGFYSVRVKFPPSYNDNKQVFKGGFSDDQIGFKITGQASASPIEQKQMISSFQRPKSRTGGVIVYNFAQATAMKFSDRPSVAGDAEYSQHASFRDFFSSKSQAEKIWKTKTLWGKLGFSYQQFNEEEYFENIIQYCQPKNLKLRGITSDTNIDTSVIPTISSLANPSDYTIEVIYGKGDIKAPQVYNNFDVNTPRTELQRMYPDGSQSSQMPATGSNQESYSGSIHTFTAMTNIVAKPTPISAEELPTLSKFGYYLITSDLVPTYKDIVSKGDPLGLLGVVPKTSLSSQDFIPLANSDIVQVLNQNTPINNIRVKILNPDLSNPELNENSSVILRIDVPVLPPTKVPEEDAKTPAKKCPKTGEKVCKCPPTSIEKISKK